MNKEMETFTTSCSDGDFIPRKKDSLKSKFEFWFSMFLMLLILVVVNNLIATN